MRRKASRRGAGERRVEGEFRRLHVRVARAFGPHLRKRRERAGLSQSDLAGTRYDRSFIAKLEAGASLPSLETVRELAAAIGVTPRALIPKEL